ncbi:MAG: shikimate dehydrogenase [Halanaerobiales bacterium]
MNKSNRDKIIGLIGQNIEGSLSPQIHNYLSNVMGLKYHYFLFDIEPGELSKAVQAIKTLQIRGVNVTIPYKGEIIEDLDEIDQRVKKIGAVNTVINEKGKLSGYNTDLDGFDEMAYNKGITFEDKKVALLGAGGAARAVLYYLKEQNIEQLYLSNRTMSRAEQVKEDFKELRGNITVVGWDNDQQKEAVRSSDIIINATPLGLENRYQEQSPVKSESINEDQILIDLVYKPRVTKFLSFGKKKNAKIVSGIEMLVYQAVKSFELWTGKMVEYHLVDELIKNL